MKKHGATLLILMLAVLTGLASAQTRTITAQVPFDYVLKGKTMLAGETTIKVQGDVQPILWISSENARAVVFVNSAQSNRASSMTKLVFHRYGDRYFLARIERAGESLGYELPATKLEAELRAQNVAENDVILLASAE